MVFPQTILPLCTEIFIDGAWVDITSKVYSRDPITITRGQANEAVSVTPSSMTLTLNNRDGRFSPRNPRGIYFGKIGRNTPIRQSIISTGYLQIKSATGTTPGGGAYVSTPDTASLDITGDLDLRVDVDLTTWDENMEFISKWTTTGNQRSYALTLGSNGKPVLWWSNDGTTVLGATCPIPVPISQGRLAIRGTLDVNNGGGGYTIQFYTAPTMAGPWTAFGDPQFKVGLFTVFSSSAPVRLIDNPDSNLGGSVIHGKLYSAQIYNGIAGTLVANPTLAAVTNLASSFVDSTGKTWSLVGDVEASTRDVRASMEIPTWPQTWDTTGRDVYTSVECAGPFRRLGQGASPLSSVLRAGILGSATGLQAYWPAEEQGSALRLASGIAGGPAMAILGSPDFGAEAGFKASLPLPNLLNSQYVGTLKTYASTGKIALRFVMRIPATGTTNGAIVARLYCGGTAPRWDISYGIGGSLALTPYTSTDGALTGSGPVAFNVDDTYFRVSLELQQSGSDVAWALKTLTVGDLGAPAITGTLTGRTVTSASRVMIDPNKNMDDVAVGHISVESAISSFTGLVDELAGYNGETAGRRIQRVCREQGIVIQGNGDLDDSERMGPQLPATFLDTLLDCARVDMGVLYEPRDLLSVGYLPRSALYNQVADVTLVYTDHEMNGLEPVEDDQQLRNDVTATRPEGSSARATQLTGPLSVSSPPDGVGVYDDTQELNVYLDAQLDDQAGWRLRLGTLDEARFPTLDLNLAARAFTIDADLTRRAASLDVGSRLAITGLPLWLPPDDISQVVLGTVETLAQYEWDLSYNLAPSSPYDLIGLYAPAATGLLVARYSSDGSTLSTNATTTATSISIATPSGPLWTHVDGDYDILMSGERMTVTNVTGTSSPQTFTVVRSVNGIVKAQLAGATMELFTPAYYAL